MKPVRPLGTLALLAPVVALLALGYVYLAPLLGL